jgi:hypothetical protein
VALLPSPINLTLAMASILLCWSFGAITFSQENGTLLIFKEFFVIRFLSSSGFVFFLFIAIAAHAKVEHANGSIIFYEGHSVFAGDPDNAANSCASSTYLLSLVTGPGFQISTACKEVYSHTPVGDKIFNFLSAGACGDCGGGEYKLGTKFKSEVQYLNNKNHAITVSGNYQNNNDCLAAKQLLGKISENKNFAFFTTCTDNQLSGTFSVR